MADASVPLSIVSNTDNQYFWAQIGIGSNVLNQNGSAQCFWILVLDRSDLSVVYNQLLTTFNQAPDLGDFNTSSYMLVVATMGVGLNNQPQGDFFQFLDANGAGRELRRVDQIATQFNCGSLGTFGYALVGVLGNLNQPGFEACQLGQTGTGPILTVQLMPFQVNGQTLYTPVQLSNA